MTRLGEIFTAIREKDLMGLNGVIKQIDMTNCLVVEEEESMRAVKAGLCRIYVDSLT